MSWGVAGRGASTRARELVTAIDNGVRLAQVCIPGALQFDPAAATDPGDDGTPFKVEMRVLERIDGAGRLGSSVLSTMSAALANNGIGHLPPELPSSQDEIVRLQLAGSLGYRQTELGQLYRHIAPDKPATVKLRALAAAFCRRNPDWILGQHRTSPPDIRLFHRALPPQFAPLP